MTYEVSMELEGSMLTMEEQIQAVVNEVGRYATKEALSHFDTNGEPVMVGDVRYTSKGQSKKKSRPRMA